MRILKSALNDSRPSPAHGDHDTFVPYQQAVLFHKALNGVKANNQPLTIPGKGHGDFSPAQNLEAWKTLRLFLEKAGITPYSER